MDPRIERLDLKTSLRAVADLVMPRECIVCGTRLHLSERHICLECMSDIPFTHFETVSRNPMADSFNELIQRRLDGFEPYSYATALFFYRAGSRFKNITRRLKYSYDIAEGRYFSAMLGKALASSPMFRDVDMVVPIPLHRARKWKRGYNQAEVIAKEVSRELGAAMSADMLSRRRRTRSQTSLGREGRSMNVAGAFRLRSVPGTAPVHILLVDDVFTTGATAVECQRVLRSVFPASSTRISVATLGFANAG